MSQINRRARVARAAAVIPASAAFAIGCASIPPPTQTVTQAEVAVNEAEQAMAQEHAPLDLYQAQEKLQRARDAMADEDHLRARRLAEEALVQAELAEEKAKTARAEDTAQELQETVAALRMETDRAIRAREQELRVYGDGVRTGTNPNAGGMTR